MGNEIKIDAIRNNSAALAYAWDNRMQERVCTLLRIARLTTDYGNGLGIVHNVSEHGMMVEVHPSLKSTQFIAVDLGIGEIFKGTVCWREGAELGIYFASAVDVEKVLENPGTIPGGNDWMSHRFTAYQKVAVGIDGDLPPDEAIEVTQIDARVAASEKSRSVVATSFPDPDIKRLPRPMRIAILIGVVSLSWVLASKLGKLVLALL